MGESDVQVGIDILQRNRIPHYFLPESMSKAYATALSFKNQLEATNGKAEVFPNADKDTAHAILNKAIEDGRSYLPEEESVKVLKAYGLPVVESGLATSAEEAVELAEKIGYPLVMKVISDDIVHKFDVKGVVLDIESKTEAEDAYNSIIENVAKLQPEAVIKGIYVRKMIPAGEEVILGVKDDISFGKVVMFGLGGIFVEIFKDISFKIAPVNKSDAFAMINETKASAILSGARGRAVRDIESLQNCIQRLSQLAMDCPQIKELDINPLIVLEEGNGSFVADAKIML